MTTFFFYIEKYRVAEQSSSGFECHDVCRDCATKKAKNGFYVEFDKYAQKYPSEFEFDCDYCEASICATELTEGNKIENVIY